MLSHEEILGGAQWKSKKETRNRGDLGCVPIPSPLAGVLLRGVTRSVDEEGTPTRNLSPVKEEIKPPQAVPSPLVCEGEEGPLWLLYGAGMQL